MKASASKALLYFDDDTTDDTYVYEYPGGKLVGKLTGFHDPTLSSAYCSSTRTAVPRRLISTSALAAAWAAARSALTATWPPPVMARSASGRAASPQPAQPASTTRAWAAGRRSVTTTMAISSASARPTRGEDCSDYCMHDPRRQEYDGETLYVGDKAKLQPNGHGVGWEVHRGSRSSR